MSKADLLRELRERTGSLRLTPKECWQAPGLPTGVAKGIVAELLGSARTEWLLALFALYPDHLIFWCERQGQINPLAIQQRGVNLQRIKFIHSDLKAQQALRLALDSQVYPFVVAPNTFDELKVFQRLHLLAEKSKSTVFLLAQKNFSSFWPISLQLQVDFASPGFQIDIHRQKHGAQA